MYEVHFIFEEKYSYFNVFLIFAVRTYGTNVFAAVLSFESAVRPTVGAEANTK